MSRVAYLALLALPLVLVDVAQAAERSGQSDEKPAAVRSDGWTVTLGLEGRLQNAWVGADHDNVIPNLLFDVRPQGTPQRFDTPRDSIGIALLDAGTFRAGPVGNLERPRPERHHPELTGLGDVKPALEIGGFAEYWWAPWLRSRAELRQGVTGHHGVVSDLTSDVVVPAGGGWTLSGGPRVTWASARALSPYFDVDAAQAAASGLPVYAAHGGVRSVGAGAKVRYDIDHHWFTHTFLEYERLRGDAAASPIVVERGSPNQTMLGVGVGYSFDVPRF